MRIRGVGHVGAAILLGGFILIEPPMKTAADGRSWMVDDGQPVTAWTKIDAYDTKAACDDKRTDRIADAPDDLGEDAEQAEAGSKIGAAFNARLKSKCVADTDFFPAPAAKK
ncbi:MAG TPA: hypothetical protein VGR62_04795 [Candidatus Binatia bacterium]|jgi:hypothetical protein|nr:hypothetical protein [Candidatus Binatia bacterium]